MNENELSVETQEVAEPVESVEKVEVAEQPIAEQEAEVVTPVVEEKPKFSESDKAFANMRRDLEKARSENQKYMEAMKRFGFNGATSEDILDEANAHYYGKTVDEIKKQRLAEESAIQERETMQQRLQFYEQKEIEEKMASDLAKIQKINPNVKSLDELGEPYFDLIRKGIDGERAYKLLEVDGLIANQNIRVEQEVIKKMKANSQSSVGALDSVAATPKSVANMTDAEFEAYRQKALRGELRRI